LRFNERYSGTSHSELLREKFKLVSQRAHNDESAPELSSEVTTYKHRMLEKDNFKGLGDFDLSDL